ncbi:GNAT family N-acetyltransferase [Tateyamaria sp.]|uniref:GNAT family N-acetyltransferase n=1 Tax=Tateyamaria sp. TaxID=1929288 RepID=UPI003B220CCC
MAYVLTPNVLAPLPEPLHLPHGTGHIADWVRARAEESDVFSVLEAASGVLVGLLIIASEEDGTLHLGYMLADPVWGRGYATEVIRGLLTAIPPGHNITVLAGVEFDHPASSGVLFKCGFEVVDRLSTPQTRFYSYIVL